MDVIGIQTGTEKNIAVVAKGSAYLQGFTKHTPFLLLGGLGAVKTAGDQIPNDYIDIVGVEQILIAASYANTSDSAAIRLGLKTVNNEIVYTKTYTSTNDGNQNGDLLLVDVAGFTGFAVYLTADLTDNATIYFYNITDVVPGQSKLQANTPIYVSGSNDTYFEAATTHYLQANTPIYVSGSNDTYFEAATTHYLQANTPIYVSGSNYTISSS